MMGVHVVGDWDGFAGKIVLFADELVVAEYVEMLASGHLLPANEAGETIQVENLVSRFAYEIRRIDSLKATAAFRAVTPAKRIDGENSINLFFAPRSPSFSFHCHAAPGPTGENLIFRAS